MSEPTKEELLDFMRKHGPEKVDSITDTESVIRHFRCTSKVYKEQRDQYKAERDSLIDDLAVVRANNKRLERENGHLLNQSNYYARHVELGEERLKQLLPKEHNYVVLTSHIRQKAEHNPGVSRYIDLVNYIDRLERD